MTLNCHHIETTQLKLKVGDGINNKKTSAKKTPLN